MMIHTIQSYSSSTLKMIHEYIHFFLMTWWSHCSCLKISWNGF